MCCQLHHKSICCLLKIRTLTRKTKIFCATITSKDNLSEQTESNCHPLLASDIGLKPTNPEYSFCLEFWLRLSTRAPRLSEVCFNKFSFLYGRQMHYYYAMFAKRFVDSRNQDYNKTKKESFDSPFFYYKSNVLKINYNQDFSHSGSTNKKPLSIF